MWSDINISSYGKSATFFSFDAREFSNKYRKIPLMFQLIYI